MYLASLTRRVLLQALPSTCVNAISTVLMEGYHASLPFLCVKEGCRIEGTLGHSYGYWVPVEMKSVMQGFPYSNLCLVFAVQRSVFNQRTANFNRAW